MYVGEGLAPPVGKRRAGVAAPYDRISLQPGPGKEQPALPAKMGRVHSFPFLRQKDLAGVKAGVPNCL